MTTPDPLAVARDLIDRGVPVFACPPGDGPKGYRLPNAWQTIRPDPRRLDVYRPGYALAAVMGHVYDVLDRDPRNGPGELPCAWPDVYGIAGTPGGGEHYWISATGLPKSKIAQGWDLQAGTPDGGRGFVFIPGTPGYGWLTPPDWPRQGDDSTAELREYARGRTAPSGPSQPVGGLGEPIPIGSHQEALFRYAASLRARACPEHEARVLVERRAADCVPPWAGPDDPWTAVQHAYRYPEGAPPVEPVALVGFSRPAAAGAPTAAEPAAPRLTVHDSNDLEAIPPPTPLIAGLLDVDTLAFLSGKFGSYKTFVSLAWAACLATGTSWGSFQVPAARPVLYVAAEGAAGLRWRLEAWRQAHGEIPRDAFRIVPHAVRLDRDPDVGALIDAGQGCGLIVLDTLHKMAPGAEEQSAKEMGLVLAVADRIRRETGATILFDHHTGHAGERARGSSSLEDDADTAWVIALDTEDRKTAVRTLTHRKAKDAELQESRRLVFNPAGNSGHVTPGPIETWLTKNARALNALWVAVLGVAGAEGMSDRALIRALRAAGVRFDDANIPAVTQHLKCWYRHQAGELQFYGLPEWATPPPGPARTPDGPTGWTIGAQG